MKKKEYEKEKVGTVRRNKITSSNHHAVYSWIATTYTSKKQTTPPLPLQTDRKSVV